MPTVRRLTSPPSEAFYNLRNGGHHRFEPPANPTDIRGPSFPRESVLPSSPLLAPSHKQRKLIPALSPVRSPTLHSAHKRSPWDCYRFWSTSLPPHGCGFGVGPFFRLDNATSSGVSGARGPRGVVAKDED